MKNKVVEIRIEAVASLKKLKDKDSAISLLIKSLEDDNWRVRKTAVETLLGIRSKKVIKELISALNHEESANARNSSMEALIALGSEATDYLIDAFKSSGHDARKFIIDIMGRTRDVKALPLIFSALKDEDLNVRASAVEQFCNFHDTSAVNTLISILNSGDMWLAYHAADGLSKIGDASAIDALVSVLPQKDLRMPAIKALGKIAEAESLSSIVPFLKDESKAIREETLKAVEQFLERGVPEDIIIKHINSILADETNGILAPYAESDKTDIKVAATILLGLLKNKKAVASLLEMSVDPDIAEQETITKALIVIGRTEPDYLIPLFHSTDSYQRRIICEIAGRVGNSAFFNPLVSLLADEDGHVRAKAAIALSSLDNPETVKHIKPLLLDEYVDVQEAAIDALSRLKKWLNVDEIIKGLSDKNPVLRKNYAAILGLIRAATAIDALGNTLRDSNIKVRAAVVDAIGLIDTPAALKFLLLALSDESPDVRKYAAIALSRIASEEVIEPLILLLNDTDVFVRVSAAKSLGNTRNKKAVEPLIKALSDKSGFVRITAIEALGNFKDARVKDIMLKLLKDSDAEIRATAIESLSIFDGVAKKITPLLKDREWAVRKKAVDVLGKFFRDESAAYLKEAADTDKDYQVRETAARYLGV
ncbi:MAG: HEAT repeat domain-containing protein [Nitrospirae bacterium]|nr:HEAT repeat domain-containing protein [Nitrospirota bacterium]